MVAAAATLRVSDVIRDVRRAFGDEDGVQIKDEDLVRWINDGQREIVSNNPILKAKATVSSVAGNNNYPLPADIYQIENLTYDGKRINGVGFEEGIARFGALTDGGDPYYWYMWGNELYLYPTPNTVKTITMYYTQAPAPVTGAGDLLSVPDRYFNALVEYVKMQAYELDEDWQAQQAKTQKFHFHMDKLTNAENNMSGPSHIMRDPFYEDDYLYGY